MSDEDGKLVHLRANAFWLGQDEPKRRRARKPSLKRAIATAVKATGKAVTSVTLPDGIKLGLGEAETAAPVNPWLAELEGKPKQ